jgi:hypothetical protein
VRSFPPARPGTAPLEFVLVFPLLLAVALAVVWVGVSGARRIAVVSEARGHGWAGRERADAGDVLRLNHDPNRSLIQSRRTVSLPKGLGLPPLSAEATTGTHFRFWATDDRVYLDEPTGETGPHLGLLRTLAERNPESLGRVTAVMGRLGDAALIDPAVALGTAPAPPK